MAKYQAKTTENKKSVAEFIKTIPDDQRQKDARAIVKIMKDISGFPAKMWGPAIIGFGTYHYVYESGHEGDSPLLGFSPRKTEFALYLGLPEAERKELLGRLGKHKSSKACIYIKRMDDINIDVFKEMVTTSLKNSKTQHC